MTNKTFVSVIILLLFLFLAAFFVSVASLASNQQNEIFVHEDDDTISYSEYLNKTVPLREIGSFKFTVSETNSSFESFEETTTLYLMLPNTTVLDSGETENYSYYWNGSAFIIDEI